MVTRDKLWASTALLLGMLLVMSRTSMRGSSRSRRILLPAAVSACAWLLLGLFDLQELGADSVGDFIEGYVEGVAYTTLIGVPFIVFVIGAAVTWACTYPEYRRDPLERYPRG